MTKSIIHQPSVKAKNKVFLWETISPRSFICEFVKSELYIICINHRNKFVDFSYWILELSVQILCKINNTVTRDINICIVWKGSQINKFIFIRLSFFLDIQEINVFKWKEVLG